ncbi:MAG: glutamate-1-semialdehyde 2,1-aminomutase [Actinomycetota bacterium]
MDTDRVSRGTDPAVSAATRALQRRAHELIPGGAHTYAKGDDQYPQVAPPFIARGRGCHVWDVDGNEYIEYAMGLRAVTLGHAFPPVVEAAERALRDGQNFNRPAPVEVEAAEALVGMVESADMVKFTKDGSTANTAALKLARAYTGRDLVALCIDHPFFSYDDWAMTVTDVDAGIPRGVAELTLTFRYDDIDSVRALFARHPGRIACLFMEPAKYADPSDGFLAEVRRLCDEDGALLVFDENISGFRWDNGGAQRYYGVQPHLTTFGKAMANGFALAALAGRRDVMELGGLHHDRERVFLLSTTHGAETHALAAAVATMEVYRREPVVERLWAAGERLKAGCDEVIAAHGVGDAVEVIGKPCCLVFATRDGEGRPSQPYRTLFMQELVRNGVLAPSFIVSYSHTDEDVDRTVEAVDAALAVYARALEDGPERYLVGAPTKSVYRRFN